MPYGPYYRQRGAITGRPVTSETIYGEDVRRPAVRADDLYERYGEVSPYEGIQTANKKAISGVEGGEISSATSYSAPAVTGFTGTMAEDPNAGSTFAYYQGLPGGRAPVVYQGLGRTGDVIASLGTRTGLGLLGIPSLLINPSLISRAFVIPLLYGFAREMGLLPETQFYNMEDYGYTNPQQESTAIFNTDEGMALPGDVMSPGGEALSGLGSPEGGFSGYGGEPM